VIQQHEQEQVWKIARELAWDVYSITNRGGFDKDHRVRDCVRRASFSIMANVAEGFERGIVPELWRYLEQAQSDIDDLSTQLNRAQGLGYVNSATLARIELALTNLSGMIESLKGCINVDAVGFNNVDISYQVV